MYRLLIADDEMIERKVLFKTLSQNLKGQCEIFQAENGREALEIYEKELMLVLEEAMRMAGEEKDFQKEKTEEVSEEEKRDDPEELAEDDAGENLRMNKVTEIIRDYIRENYMYDLSVQDLADKMNYSEPYFCRLFKQSFGQNFTAYLTEYRVSMAKKMLEEPTVNIKDIGKSVGYEDSNYFTKVFRRITGQSPSEYRNTVFREK